MDSISQRSSDQVESMDECSEMGIQKSDSISSNKRISLARRYICENISEFSPSLSLSLTHILPSVVITGHTAFEKVEEADKEVLDILDLYARVYEELMAVPVIKGRKSEGERFPGGRYTTTVEAFIPAALRAIQGATSHSLGQNFAKMFDINFEDPSKPGGKCMPWQNSWGLTTRSIGVMIMVHGDDKGLVLPPRIAPIQVVIVYIEKSKMSNDEVESMRKQAKELERSLKSAGIRVKLDDRANYTGGFKFSYWELKGVPMILTLGQREMENKTVECALRVDRMAEKKIKTTLKWDELNKKVPDILEQVHSRMLAKARKDRDAHISVAMNMEEFKRELNKGNMILAPWCELKSTEDLVKELTKDCGTYISIFSSFTHWFVYLFTTGKEKKKTSLQRKQ